MILLITRCNYPASLIGQVINARLFYHALPVDVYAVAAADFAFDFRDFAPARLLPALRPALD